jgi:RNA polymerase sigma factor (sigma-70 family)
LVAAIPFCGLWVISGFDKMKTCRIRRISVISDTTSKSWQMSSGLLVRIAAGDRDAVEECLARYGELVWALSRKYLSNRAEAEELVQEIFIDLWRHAGRFDERVASELTFVTMIARRRLIDFRRKRQRTISTTQIPSELDRATVSVEDSLELGEEADWAREQFGQLRPIERKVLEMAIDGGLSYSQIADALDMPLGTVKTTARRGLMHLRVLFHQDRPRHLAEGVAP